MYFSTTRSSLGKRAQPPDWWLKLLSYVPRLTLDALEPKEWTEEKAKWWVEHVPSKCPFERQWWIGNTLILYVPPLCPLNPLSTQLFSIRLKAQTFLTYSRSRDF